MAIGLPDLTVETLPGQLDDEAERSDAAQPVYLKLDIATVVDNLLLGDRERRDAHKLLARITDNLRALGVVDEHGRQIAGEMIGELQGLDGPFIYYLLMNHQLDYAECRELVEFLIDHDVIQRILDRKLIEARREWIKSRLRERRVESPQTSWEDVEEEYEREFPRELTRVETIFAEFSALVPHPELHGGKRAKTVWSRIEDDEDDFLTFVDKNRLAHEEGSLFSYLARVMKTATKIHEATGVEQFESLADRVRRYLSVIDARLVARL